jgi:hypothetical protein
MLVDFNVIEKEFKVNIGIIPINHDVFETQKAFNVTKVPIRQNYGLIEIWAAYFEATNAHYQGI